MRRITASGIVPLALLALGAAGLSSSERFAYATFRARANGVTLLVDAYPAALRTRDRFVPISVAVGVSVSGPTILLTPASLELLDASGEASPAATYEDVLAGYDKLELDAELIRMRPLVVADQFAMSLRIPAPFYPPVSATRTRTGRVELTARSWLRTVVYFPRPPHGLDGILTLRLRAEGLTEPLDVRFELPRFPAGE